MNLSQKIVNATGWQMISVVCQAVLQIGVLSVLSRQLSPEEFGVVAIANIFIMFASVLTMGSVRPAIIQRPEVDDVFIRTAFSLSLLLGVSFTFLLISVSGYVADYFEVNEVKGVLVIMSFSFFFNSLGIVSQSLFEKSLAFKRTALANIFSYFLGYSLTAIVLAINGYGVWSLAVAVVVQAILRNAVLYACSRHSILPVYSLDEIKFIIKFSTGSMSKWFFNYVALQADNFIVGKALGTASLGYYSMAFTAMDLPRRFLSNIVGRILLPSLSIIQDDEKRFVNAATRAYGLLNIIMMPISILLIILSEDLVLLVLGDNWLQVIQPLQIMLTQIPLRTAIRTSDALTTAKGVLYRNALRKFAYAIVVIIFAMVGSHWGLVGVALGVTLAVVLHFVMVVGLGLSVMGIQWNTLIAALLPGIKLSTLIGVSLLLLAVAIDSHIILIVTSITVYIMTFTFIFICFPGWLGEGAIWVLKMLSQKLKTGSKIHRIFNYALTKV